MKPSNPKLARSVYFICALIIFFISNTNSRANEYTDLYYDLKQELEKTGCSSDYFEYFFGTFHELAGFERDWALDVCLGVIDILSSDGDFIGSSLTNTEKDVGFLAYIVVRIRDGLRGEGIPENKWRSLLIEFEDFHLKRIAAGAPFVSALLDEEVLYNVWVKLGKGHCAKPTGTPDQIEKETISKLRSKLNKGDHLIIAMKEATGIPIWGAYECEAGGPTPNPISVKINPNTNNIIVLTRLFFEICQNRSSPSVTDLRACRGSKRPLVDGDRPILWGNYYYQVFQSGEPIGEPLIMRVSDEIAGMGASSKEYQLVYDRSGNYRIEEK